MSRAGRRVRWHVKKLARASMVLFSWASGYLVLRRWFDRKPRIRVLTYHRFRPCNQDPFSVDVDQFERQMRWLAERRLAISLDDLQAFVAGDCRLQDGAVLVTVDDGYQEIHSRALPILRAHGIPAVVFVPTADVLEQVPEAQTAAASSHTDPRLSPAELAELVASFVEVASHSHQHLSLASLSIEEIRRQLSHSKRSLEALLRRHVTAFAYPFGTRRDFSVTTTRLVAEAGYQVAFTSQHGAIGSEANPHMLPRIKVEGGEALWMFKLLVAGGLDLWGIVDRTLWWLQQSKGSVRTTN